MTYVQNRKARFNFEIIDTVEAGIVLAGHEVKAIRAGKAKLVGAYVLVRGGEAYLVGVHIAPYQPANAPREYDPDRPRKILLSQRELTQLERETEREGLTAIPLRLYNKGRKIKVEIGLARGKKKYDKRETIKRRDVERDIKRSLK